MRISSGRSRATVGILIASALVLSATLIETPRPESAANAATSNTTVQRWQSADNGDRLSRLPDLSFGGIDTRSLPTITVNPSDQLQYMDGFGSTLNEAGCSLLSGLPASAKAEVFQKVFNSTTGVGHSLVRVPIGLNDFSLTDYTLDDTAGDFSMNNFNLTRDKTLLIPCIKAAQSQGSFLITASPWTAPKWMKSNNSYFNGGSLIEPNVDSRYYQSMALYLRKYVASMQTEGVHVDCVNPQNEPGYPAAFGSTIYSVDQMKVFIRDYLGPEFRNNNVNACIRGFEWNRDNWTYPDTLMNDPAVAQYIAGINWHNYDCLNPSGCSGQGLTNFIANHPGVSNWMSEHTDIDGVHYEWANGEKWGKEILQDVGLGQNGWIYWNLVLDQTGGPWSKDPVTGADRSGPQNPQIVVNTTNQSVTYLPDFYYEGQISKFVRPGAHHVAASGGGAGLDFQAFTNSNGVRSLIVINSDSNTRDIRITEGSSFVASVAGHSINTFTWGQSSTTESTKIVGGSGRCLDVADNSSANETPIQVWDCVGSGNQTWATPNDGTIRSLGKCLDISAGATTNGSKVQLYDCNGTGAQQWKIGFDGAIRNPASGRCLDVNGSANGSRLQIWDCTGASNQNWKRAA